MKLKSLCGMALCAAGLGAGSMLSGCAQETPPPTTVSAADKAKQQKTAEEQLAADKAAIEKAAAEKAVAGKVAADKAAAEKTAQAAKTESAMLPADLVETKAEVARTLAQMDLTMAKLDTLSTAKGDLDDPSESALGAIATLESEIKSLQKRADEMRDRGAAYFEAWEKQLAAMSTPEVVAMATKRKEELSAKYSEVLTSMQEARSALDTYWAEMETIRKAIDDDLTPETQKALVGQVKSAKDKAAALKTRVEAAAAKLDQVSLLYTKP